MRARLSALKIAPTGTATVATATRASGRGSPPGSAGVRPPCTAFTSAGSRNSGTPRAAS